MDVAAFLASVGLAPLAHRVEQIGPCRLILGDCREALLSVVGAHSCVSDPPYELGFMGKGWDSSGIANDPSLWRAVSDALLPGGHVLAFSGSRTYHRMTCAIEDAGFDIRDQIMWLYGSGFPKSLNVSKAIDAAAGATREKIATGKPVKRLIPGADQNATGSWIKDNGRTYQPGVELAATDEAKQWDGWGTALKPAHEPICVARKPLDGTVAGNVIEHGVGGLNIDGCRVPHLSEADRLSATPQGKATSSKRSGGAPDVDREGRQSFDRPDTTLGRFPANVIHDGSEEVLAAFPDAPGAIADVPAREGTRKTQNAYSKMNATGAVTRSARNDSTTTAARFFYCAKASKKERGEGNNHPTVKPTALMQYLCRLVTPPGGMVLDPFMGSGSTGVAAVREGFRFTGIERDPAYFEIALKRIEKAVREAGL